MINNKAFIKEYIQEQLLISGFNLLTYFEKDEFNEYYTIDYECMTRGKFFTGSFETLQDLFNFLDEMRKYNQN